MTLIQWTSTITQANTKCIGRGNLAQCIKKQCQRAINSIEWCIIKLLSVVIDKIVNHNCLNFFLNI